MRVCEGGGMREHQRRWCARWARGAGMGRGRHQLTRVKPPQCAHSVHRVNVCQEAQLAPRGLRGGTRGVWGVWGARGGQASRVHAEQACTAGAWIEPPPFPHTPTPPPVPQPPPLACCMATGWVASAVCTKSGPSAEPPMPIATTLVSGLPVTPFQSPPRTLSGSQWAGWCVGVGCSFSSAGGRWSAVRPPTHPFTRSPTHPRRP